MSETAFPSAGDLQEGDSGPEFVLENVTRRDIVKYAGASGDFNPIHYDEPLTREAGNPEVFAQGMFTMGVTSTMVADWVGLASVRDFHSRFQARVFPGDTISISGVVTDVSEDGRRIEADLEATNQDGETVLTGGVVARLPEDE